MWPKINIQTLSKELANFDEKLLAEIENEDQKPNFSNKNNQFKYPLIILASIVFCSGFFWYILSFSNISTSASEICQSVFQKNEGIKLEESCSANLVEKITLQSILVAEKYEQKYEQKKQKLIKEISELEQELAKEKEIAKDFGIDKKANFTKTTKLEADVSSLKNNIQSLQIETDKLNKNNLKNYDDLLQIVSFADINSEKAWIKSMSNDSLVRQNSFKIEDTLKNLKGKISADVVKSALSYKFHSGAEFAQIFETANLPNIVPINQNIDITGNKELDAKIYKIAVERGYKNRGMASKTDFCYEEKIIVAKMNCQVAMKQDILNLMELSKKKKTNMVVTSIFRNPEDQKTILLERLVKAVKEKYKNTKLESLLDSKGDEIINEVLKTTSVPNYSKHHTGYTIDFADLDNKGFAFSASDSYSWLRANNFLVARENGFIPSYPEGVAKVGPEPESWEFVWVGKENSLQKR